VRDPARAARGEGRSRQAELSGSALRQSHDIAVHPPRRIVPFATICAETGAQETEMRPRSDYPFVTAVIEIFADWWKQRRDR
jgi:hypothetical protein